MRNSKTPKVPYIQGRHQYGKQRPTLIRLTPSFTKSIEGNALGVAGHWHKTEHPSKTGHYVVDDAKSYRSVYDRTIVGTKEFSQKGVLRIVICAEPVSRRQFWDLNEHHKVLDQAAELVAALSEVYKIRQRYLNEEQLDEWYSFRTRRRGGIVVDELRGWPNEEFLQMIRRKTIK